MTDHTAAAALRAIIVREAPRVLGMMDREPHSPTRGCCDRTWWAWKFTDFPGARFQESVCVLSYLYATAFDGNPYHRNKNLLEWIGAALDFWRGQQHGDGSFDEAYPFERSLAATAFTSFYVGEALGFLEGALPDATRKATTETLRRAGHWLSANDETHGMLSNHLAAAAAALAHIARATGEQRFAKRARFFVDRILKRQSSEGWYEEYGGADPGYQTHGSFYLARYWQLLGQADVLASLAKGNRFLAHFIHPDGSLAGEYASRGTQTYYPAAFEMLAAHDGSAAWIADTMRAGIGTASAAGLAGVDPYNYFPQLNNLVFAALHADTRAVQDPTPPMGLSWFPLAGMARVRNTRYDAYVGVAKGGAVKVFDRRSRKLLMSDSGWVGKTTSGHTVASHYLDSAREVSVTWEQIQVYGAFQEVSRPVFTPLKFGAFRLFTMTVGRLPAVAKWLKRLLVRVLIYRRSPLAISCRRVIALGEFDVTVTDELEGPDASRLKSLTRAASFTSIHMGSARYFVAHELEPMPPDVEVSLDPARVVKGVISSYSVHTGGPY